MTTTRIYRSTDSGAPVLTGENGSLLNLLDKCLVDGYGSKTAAGWSRPYTGTNKGAYRNAVAAGGSGMYLRVLDDGSATGGARNALVRAYLTMSDVDTGTGETPTAAQLSTGTVWRKSNTVDSTARSWILIADELTFYLWVDTGTSSNGNSTYGAGDIASDVPGDAYRYFICGRETAYAGGGLGTHAGFCFPLDSLVTAPSSDSAWMGRSYAGSGDPVRACIIYPWRIGAGVYIGAGNAMANPTPGTGLVYYIPAIVVANFAVRGRFRGMFCPLNTLAGVAAGTEVANPPGLDGRTLATLRHFCTSSGSNAIYDGHIMIDITGPWS